MARSLQFSSGKFVESVIYYEENREKEGGEKVVAKIADAINKVLSHSKNQEVKFVFNHETSWVVERRNGGGMDPHSILRKEPLSVEERQWIWEALWCLKK